MRTAVVTAATKSFLYAWPQCIRAISTAVSHHQTGDFIFCTDESEEGETAFKIAKAELPKGWQAHIIKLPIKEDEKSYEASPQLKIAALQGAGFAYARTKLRVDRVWSVESDNIVYSNTLRCLEWALDMPHADGSPVYGVAASPYWNGSILCGHGSPTNQIYQDFLPHERKLPDWMRGMLERTKLRPASENGAKIMKWIEERSKKYGPDGSLWEVIQKHGWRERGWFENCFPGIGEGALVPIKWCGLGSTLIGKLALQLADFNGYSGGGTQDLYLIWNRWHQAGVRLCAVPHVPVDHVKRNDKGELTHYIVYHELAEGFKGHLRLRSQPFIQDPLNYKPAA